MLPSTSLERAWSYSARTCTPCPHFERRLEPFRDGRCSHAGIVNVVKDAVRKLVRPVYMVNRVFVSFDSLRRQSR